MITISTTTYSTIGPVYIRDNGKHNFGDTSRRVSRIATLDGSSVFPDKGSAITDESIAVNLDGMNETDYNILRTMTKGYSTLHLACTRGRYLVAPVSITQSIMNFYIKQELE